jgi:CubicO group peptidase (beta-lactamase class C family)
VTLPSRPHLTDLLEQAVREGVAPGFAAALLLRGEWLHLSAAGVAGPELGPVLPTTWFDLASLTKPLATGLCALRLAQLGQIELDAPVARYLPRFARNGKADLELQDLLDHTSGLPAWRPYFRAVAEDAVGGPAFGGAPNEAAFARGRELVAAAVDGEALATPRRTATVYSDVGFLALGRVLAEAAGEPLDVLVRREVFERLGVRDLSYFDLARGPVPPDLALAATGSTRPREPAAGQEAELAGLPLAPVGLRPGEVDDDNAFACGGVAGHAGLFGTVGAVAQLAQAFLEETEGAGKLASAELAHRFATPRPGSTRALAWDRPSPESSALGSRLGRGPRGALGHLGFTGGSVWIDLDAKLVVALCSNRTLTGRGNQGIKSFRPRFHDAVAAELGL